MERFEELNSKEFQQRNETSEIYIPPGPRLGNKVVEVEGISKSFDGRLLYENLTFSVPPTAIVGIVGPNGAGKTTLFRMMTGEQQPDTGTVTLGDSVKVAYVGQIRDTLDNNKTVWEEVSGGLDILKVGDYEIASRAYIGRFNFKGQDQQKRVGELSGGERNRLQLAKILQQGANVILLDEPSNDLDIETLRALEMQFWSFRVQLWWYRMTAGSWTVLQRIFCRLKMSSLNFTRVTMLNMKHIVSHA
ncbi:ABC transporter family protein [Acinetobacter sp. 272263]|nr:ABC transporter family protein [Acinetobacter sp. 272263]